MCMLVQIALLTGIKIQGLCDCFELEGYICRSAYVIDCIVS